jgi:hypothetical protein
VRSDADIEVVLSGWSVVPPESVAKFIQALPMANVNARSSLNTISSLARGQKRLEEFKYTVSPKGGGVSDEAQARGSLTGDHNAIVRRGTNLLERASSPKLFLSVEL